VKITEIETIPLRLLFAQPFKISQGADRESLETLIVRVHTDEGIVGIGEIQAWLPHRSLVAAREVVAAARAPSSAHRIRNDTVKNLSSSCPNPAGLSSTR
jgi:L-alanine-DL-glutamate epimerase-like enolase superfamily enzyme